MTFPWTEERVARLKQRWHEGFSASEIADELGGTSRNAVISKVHRLNLPRLAHNQERKRLVEADRKKSPVSRVAPTRRLIAPASDLPIPPIPAAGLISLLDLSEATCKWPVGDPRQPGFGFCGHSPVEGKPYCAVHVALAYNGVPALKSRAVPA